MTSSSEIAGYLRRLKALPFVEAAALRAPNATSGEPTLEVIARHKKHTFRLGVLRTHLGKAEAERWIGRARNGKLTWLLFAPYVSRPMGLRLREAGVQYLDQVGNVYVALPDERSRASAFVALIEGKRPVAAVARAEAAWRAPSYQVLLTLLVEPALLGAAVRTVAERAGVSTSPVLQVKKSLLRDGLIYSRRDVTQWVPDGRDRARDLWLHGYHATLRPHLLIGRFRPRADASPDSTEQAIERALSGRFPLRWGGAAAASRLDHYYRGERTVVHVDSADATALELASALRMLPDPDGPVVVLRVPGPCALESPDTTTIHPLVAWAELLEEGHDRASEAAERLLQRWKGESL